LVVGGKLAHAFLWEHSCKRLESAQLLGRLGVVRTLAGFGFLPTLPRSAARCCRSMASRSAASLRRTAFASAVSVTKVLTVLEPPRITWSGARRVNHCVTVTSLIGDG
jgi:hypothetical protein